MDSTGGVFPNQSGKMKVVLATTKKSFRTALQARQANIIREALWVIRNNSINIHFENVHWNQDKSGCLNELP